MKYRIIILIIIIISLGQIFYRILQTHHACTHARAHTRMCAHAHARAHTCRYTKPSPPSAAQAIATRCRPTVTVRPATMPTAGYSNNHTHWRPNYPDILDVFPRIKILLGRTEMRTRDRMCFQSIRTVRDIS